MEPSQLANIMVVPGHQNLRWRSEKNRRDKSRDDNSSFR
jgi:hypothetical protein